MNLTFFWGVTALVQIAFLPGAILLRLVRLRLGRVERAGLIFGLSLLSNYLLVSLLALVGLYTRAVLIGLLALEGGALVWLYRGLIGAPLAQSAARAAAQLRVGVLRAAEWAFPEAETGSAPAALRSALLLAAGGLGLLGLAWGLALVVRNLGGVFNTWDAILSWNRWAVAWARGSFPADTGYYPQLLPANWSLTYVLTGDPSLQVFARALGPLFLLLILLLQLALGVRARSYGLLLGVFLTWLVCRGYLAEFIADGYADLPAACLGFLSLTLLLHIRAEDSRAQRRSLLWLSALMAAGAALTKQSGLYALLAFPLLARALPNWERGETAGRRWQEIGLPFAAAVVLVGSFYLAKFVAITQGLDESNLGWVTQGIFGGATWPERASTAWHNLGIYGWLFLWVIPAFVWLRAPARWLVVILLAPYTLLWVFFFSYDTRNLALALPVLGLCAGWGVEGLLEALLPGLSRLGPGRVRSGWLALAGILLLVGLSLGIGDARLASLQEARQKQILSPQLNEKLYAYFGDHPPDGKIISQYPLDYLPGFAGQQVSFWFDNLADFLHAQRQPEVGYILLPAGAIEEIQQVVDAGLVSGEYEWIFDDSSYLPVSLLRIVRSASP